MNNGIISDTMSLLTLGPRGHAGPSVHYFGDSRCRSIWQWQLILAFTVVAISVGVALLTPERFGDWRFGSGVLAIIVIAIAEEVLWRGLVVSLLEEMIGSRRAWVWAAVLYSVAHAPTIWALRDPVAGPNPVIVLAALGCGLVWGGMARSFERLLPGIFSHVLFDWTVIMMFRLWGPSV